MKGNEIAEKTLLDIDDFISDYANRRTNSNLHELLSIWDSMTREDRVSMALRIDAKDMAQNLDSQKGTVGGTMITTVLLMRLLGLNNTASRLEFLTHSAIMHAHLRDEIENIRVKGALSQRNQKNASGIKKSEYEQVMNIMRATWNEYPNTTKNAMLKKVYAHFNGAVSEQSLARWIKSEGLSPKEKVRPCPPFKLVIPS
ncbi:hypothetical protein [Pectobacterium betavasculorum]|uniref:DNA-binding protein n=1 Tax=Pectobacterium betavasculorum TaxID=55207 RepID=A0ABR4UZK3_9GAMM|nr:hypothetical protein [Pectobacterium betavasculorum]KFX20264.1 hypothetical protein JV35_09125 [Pectobacterium betavasculorum]